MADTIFTISSRSRIDVKTLSFPKKAPSGFSAHVGLVACEGFGVMFNETSHGNSGYFDITVVTNGKVSVDCIQIITDRNISGHFAPTDYKTRNKMV